MSSTVATGVVRTGPVSSQQPPSEGPPAEGEPARLASGMEPLVEAGRSESERSPGRKPRLELVAPEPARVLYERAQEPSDDSPILYCERAYVVDGLQSDEELASHLLEELAEIRDGWRERDSSQFVQLASFDHEFESEPRFPPLATLSWKDWQGRTELWVRGVRRSAIPPVEDLDTVDPEDVREVGEQTEQPTVPPPQRNGAAQRPADDSLYPDDSLPPDSLLEELRPPHVDPYEHDDGPLSTTQLSTSEASDVPLSDGGLSDGGLSDGGLSDGGLSDSPLSAALSDAPSSDAPVSEAGVREHPEEAPASGAALSATPAATKEPRKGDSGTSWQSPARSGEYPIPIAEEPAPPPASSQRVPAGEELMGLAFERMNELAYLPDLATGADFLINTLEEFLPCSAIAVHLLEQERREFLLFRALGPRAPECVGSRQPSADSLLGASVQLGRAVRIEGIARKRLWAALGLDVAYGMCCPLQQRGRVLGAVELGRTRSEGEFSDGQLKTLQFICEQFAEFVAEHPMGGGGGASSSP